MSGTDIALQKLHESAARYGLALDAPSIRKLCVHLELLLLWNRRAALVSQTKPEEIVCKHFADSLFAATACNDDDWLIDLGSGAGFPGLVIAATLPAVAVYLVDSRRKKVSFLSEVISAAQVHNARAIEGRFESLSCAPQHQGRFTVAISRALSNMEEFLRAARPFLAANGRAIAMKGPAHEAELVGLNPCRHGFVRTETSRYSLPDGSARFLVAFRRVG
jgi:16S rRNA (guanine527-N7)-methyltransferase